MVPLKGEAQGAIGSAARSDYPPGHAVGDVAAVSLGKGVVPLEERGAACVDGRGERDQVGRMPVMYCFWDSLSLHSIGFNDID